MQIPVVLKDGQERSVSVDELQLLLEIRQVLFFKRTEGWVVVDRNRDSFRRKNQLFSGDDRRQKTLLPKDAWY